MIKIRSPDFNIDQIANSGQCFRISKISSATWEVIALNRSLQIHLEGDNNHIFECSRKEYEEIWSDYFDMQRDYEKIKERVRSTNDAYLISAINYGYGIRVLKQDPWETIVTFIISQQNNIPRIKNIITKLCQSHRNRFPTPDLIEEYTDDDLLYMGLGYRAKYLKNISRAVLEQNLNLNELKNMDYSNAISFLKQFDGIGNKVANCIALFGLHKTEAFPMDVWIKRIIDNQYHGNFDTGRFSSYAGIIQQYMFFYQRSIKKNTISF
jgi:N-glycosylase/DNA lyase